MSEFNSYAKRVDNIAKEAFENIGKAKEAFEKAQKKAQECPPVSQYYNADSKLVANAARAKADYMEAKEAYANATKEFRNRVKDIMSIRKELETAIQESYIPDPAQVDASTIEILKSGILRPDEYINFMDKAKSEGNHTMARLIGQYAEEASKKYHNMDPQGRTLRYVAMEGQNNSGKQYLDVFDTLADTFSRCTQTPEFSRYWDELTSDLIRNF